MLHTVIVSGEPHSVTVYRRSKIVYIATGEYKGEQFSVEDRSIGIALKRWREAAQYKANS